MNSLIQFDDEFHRRLPHGIVGQVADYIHRQAPQPIIEVATAGALAYIAGIIGRQYNFNGDGLNLYVLLVAPTGAGKDAAKAGMNKVNALLAKRAPAASSIIGPADYASGPALVKSIARRDYACFVCVMGEVGFKLKQMADPRAPDHAHSLLRELLKLYSLSGEGRVLEGHEHSDAKLSTKPVASPAITILGEGTPTTVYGALDENQIANGLLSRFIALEYSGPVPEYNKKHAAARISDETMSRLERLFTHTQKLAVDGEIVNVGIYPDAEALIDDVRKFARATINEKQTDVVGGIWTRVAQQVSRLAALLAVSHNYESPVIDADMVRWAASLVLKNAKRLSAKFDSGEMGDADETDNQRQIEEVRKFLARYIARPNSQFGDYRSRAAHSQGAIMYRDLQHGIGKLAAFRKDRRGSTNAIKATLATLCDELAVLRERRLVLSEADKSDPHRKNGRYFEIIDHNWLHGRETNTPPVRFFQ